MRRTHQRGEEVRCRCGRSVCQTAEACGRAGKGIAAQEREGGHGEKPFLMKASLLGLKDRDRFIVDGWFGAFLACSKLKLEVFGF